MGFFSTAYFFRPTQPPLITGQELGDFCRRFAELNISTIAYPQRLQVKAGKRIDKDSKLAYILKRLVDANLWTIQDIKWDIDDEFSSYSELSERLVDGKKAVYRAFIELGTATTDICDHLARVNSPENELDLTLSDWSLEIGPIVIANLVSAPVEVGWIAVGLSGYGYLYPWRPADLVARAESHESIRRVMDLCKSTWPVDNRLPNVRQIQVRRQMEDLWPYPNLDRPWDWYWGVSESG